MRHDWIFDVLADLRVYAEQNDLPALAAQVAATLQVAELEVQDDAAGLTRRLDVEVVSHKARLARRTH